MNPGGGFDGGAHGLHTGAMTSHPGQMPAPGPAAVSVHDDRDVLREPLGIEPQISFRLFAI
jgi:hypothetical protein